MRFNRGAALARTWYALPRAAGPINGRKSLGYEDDASDNFSLNVARALSVTTADLADVTSLRKEKKKKDCGVLLRITESLSGSEIGYKPCVALHE